MSNKEDTCTIHPTATVEWDGYCLVCPSCILGYPAESPVDKEG